MDLPLEQWVPKVHPLARDAETDDPFELMAAPVSGDPQVMLGCLLQEFLWMGWGKAELLAVFGDPAYPVLCQLRDHFGQAELERQIGQLLGRWGAFRVRETIVEPDEEPEVVQIDLAVRARN